jgi:hypothetical protein
MKKVLFVMADYPDWRQSFFKKWMSPRNKEYAEKHGFEYREILSLPRQENGKFYRDNPTWLKFKVVKDWIDSGEFSDGDVISHIDADICVFNTEKSFETSKSFGYAVDSCNTHCMGAYTIKVNDWSKKLIENILDDKRYERLKNLPHWQTFREQACWYTLSGIKPHSWVPFIDLPNFGFHELKNEEVIYGLEELLNNVEIFPVEWNVTHVAGEGHNDYFMIPCDRRKTVFRHFAGGQRWQEEYFTNSQRQPWLSPAHMGAKTQSKEYEIF